MSETKTSTKDLIIRHAAALFARGDYAGTSINDIASDVGISKPALYHHFSDKEEIYFEIVLPVLRDMCLNAEEIGRSGKPPREQLHDFMRVHVEYVEKNINACTASQVAFRGLTEPTKREEALRWRDRHENVLRKILKSGVDDGSFAIADVKPVARMILSILNGFTLWYKPSGPIRAKEFAESQCNLLLNGLAAKNPRPARKARGTGT